MVRRSPSDELSTPSPEHCLRGLRKKDWLGPNDEVLGVAFDPDKRTADARKDGGEETSINFEDDAQALSFTLSQKDQAQHGAARLPLRAIENVNTLPGSLDTLTIERQPIAGTADTRGNPYHGNIVFRKDIQKQIKRMICGALALAATAYTPSNTP